MSEAVEVAMGETVAMTRIDRVLHAYPQTAEKFATCVVVSVMLFALAFLLVSAGVVAQ